MIPGLPNPWLILGFCGALVVSVFGGYLYGKHVDNLAWTAAVATQKAQATQLLADQTAKVAAAEQAQATANANLEQIRHESDLKASDADSRVRAALARVRQQAGRGACGSGALRASTGASGAENAPTSGPDGLAGQVDSLIAVTARSANELAAYARECHDFVSALK